MDSVTLVAVIGVGGTVVASLGGVAGGVWVARVSARAERTLEEERVRRTVYGACAEALLMQRDAAIRLMNELNKEAVDEPRALERMEQVKAAHDELGRAVGAVIIEGPEKVADCADAAAERLGAWVEEVVWWFELGRPDHQHRSIVELRDRALEKVEECLVQCRAALHPEPRWRRPQPLKRVRWRLEMRRARKRLGLDRWFGQ
ncbi:hypothetical protein [Streptomyces canus]|uniref:hypothetical protein n=1 Tax=Streptomyces canus TaxID=58343 RepID=UPI00225188A6|nr:hypothetical protein [Streptomyces canus]MCX4862453.1 hypothetical protein [Streptomyces canus]